MEDGGDGSGKEPSSTQGSRRILEDTCFVSHINKAVLRSENQSFEPSISRVFNHATVNICVKKFLASGVYHH